MTRAPLEKQIKPLFELKVRLTPELELREYVYNYDTPISICDRMLKQQLDVGHLPTQAQPTRVQLQSILEKPQRKMLQQMIEEQINTYIVQLT